MRVRARRASESDAASDGTSSPSLESLAEGQPGGPDEVRTSPTGGQHRRGSVIARARGLTVAPDVREIVQIPSSTHSLLFTEPACSAPWMFGFSILIISVSSLLLALLDALARFGIPADVTKNECDPPFNLST